MAEDFQSSNWWNTSKNCNDHSDNSNSQFSGFAYSASSSDWTRTPTNGGGRAEPSFHAMLREDLNTGDFLRQEPKEINQPLFLASSSSSSSSSSTSSSSSYGCSATMSMIQSLIEPETRFPPFSFDNRSHMTTYGAGSNEIQQNPMLLNSLAQMQFSNSSSFWNASSVSPIGTLFYETKPCFTTVAAKSSGGQQGKKNSGESVLKRPRIETPAPFKVRKEKLGDKITALQQLVSPFGKTDTASVLHEAIEYIKLLQNQVSVLCTPYLMNTQPKQQQKNPGKSKRREESMQDLRSRGLCLVPIAITYPVATDATSDFWTPTFEGTYG